MDSRHVHLHQHTHVHITYTRIHVYMTYMWMQHVYIYPSALGVPPCIQLSPGARLFVTTRSGRLQTLKMRSGCLGGCLGRPCTCHKGLVSPTVR